MVDIDAQSDIYGHRPGADIHSQGGEYGIALRGAVAKDSGVIARLLLDRGANTDSLQDFYHAAYRYVRTEAKG